MDEFGMTAFQGQTSRQLDAFFGLTEPEAELFGQVAPAAWERFVFNCTLQRNKYYLTPERLSPLHSCQYLMFLYFLANTAQGRVAERPSAGILADKVYNLSKIVSGADIYHQVELPRVFAFDHPVGTVLGRARYGEHFVFSQGCTVGNNHGRYPVLEDCVSLMSNAKVLGACHIGRNVIVAANAFVKDADIPDDSVVFGQDRNMVVVRGRGDANREYFKSVFSDL